MESWKYLIKMVRYPRVHGYNRRIDIEEILVSEGRGGMWRLKKGLGNSLSDRESYDSSLLKDNEL